VRLLFAALIAASIVPLRAQGPSADQNAPAAAADQSKPAADQSKPAADQAKPAPAPPPPPDNYSYDPAGRRDPFLNLLGAGAEARPAAGGREGPAGMTVDQISVRGIMESKGTLFAMIKGPDNKTYLVHQGDKLLDGTIKTITPQGLIILQEVNDPLSLVKQREVRKMLRSAEDGKA